MSRISIYGLLGGDMIPLAFPKYLWGVVLFNGFAKYVGGMVLFNGFSKYVGGIPYTLEL